MNATEKALVLKVGRFREADVWVRLLTPSRGVFNAFAFGGSRSRRRFVGCLDPFSHVLFTIGSGKRGNYTVLEEGSLLGNFPDIRKSSTKTGIAANCIKFVEAMEIGPSDGKQAYNLLLNTMVLLEEGGGSTEFVPWLFRARYAFDMGYTPDFFGVRFLWATSGYSKRVSIRYREGPGGLSHLSFGRETVRGTCSANFHGSFARLGLDSAQQPIRLGACDHGCRGSPPM